MDVTTYSEKPTNSSVSEKVRAVMVLIQQQWPHAQIDFRDPAGVWSDAIDDLTIPQMQHAKGLLKSITDKFPINAAQFRAMALRYQPVDKPTPKITRGEFDVMKRAASVAYCNRVCDMTPPSSESYHGDFDYMAVVNSVPIPSVNERGTQKHKPYWDELYRKLEELWQIWQG